MSRSFRCCLLSKSLSEVTAVLAESGKQGQGWSSWCCSSPVKRHLSASCQTPGELNSINSTQEWPRHSPARPSGVSSCMMWIFSCGLTLKETADCVKKVNGAVCLSQSYCSRLSACSGRHHLEQRDGIQEGFL